MKILLIGSGGRESALAWKIKQSPKCSELFVAPGNAGTREIAENVPIQPHEIVKLLEFAWRRGVGLTIVGPDDPLALGIVDAFQTAQIPIFGPTRAAAKAESSKSYAKQLMASVGVPTANFQIADYPKGALDIVGQHFRDTTGVPIVIKADGLARGKGVYVCFSLEDAERAIDELMVRRIYGDAGDRVLIEDFVPEVASGQEISLHAFTDGRSISMFPSAQDHKQVGNNNQGPNTGGMGAIAPVPWFTKDHRKIVETRIVESVLQGLAFDKRKFVGCLYPGVVLTPQGFLAIEYNARFGDPEAQVYMRLLKTDLVVICLACIEGRLHEINVEWNQGFAACVVIASGGYPGEFQTGYPIVGIKDASKIPGVQVFYAGTTLEDGVVKTAGGRVLSVTGVGTTLKDALDCAYEGVKHIHFEGMHYRTDIGLRALTTRN